MIYFFERSGHFIRCEVHHVGDHYELLIVRSDGTESVERFADADSVHRREVAVQAGLIKGGWNGPHGRIV
jgi:hypothetical protein